MKKPQNVLSTELSHKETLVTNRHKTSLKMPSKTRPQVNPKINMINGTFYCS